MRLSSDELGEDQAFATIAAAFAAGITVFDTAHAYGVGAQPLGQNERLVARALTRCGGRDLARIVTKGGMTRTGGGWIPDGRARTLQSDCEASLVALDGLPIDMYLIHAPDARTPWRTAVRALAKLIDEGLVSHVGVSNVSLGQLEEALDLAPVAVVEVALSPFDDRPERSGLVAACTKLGITVLAHSPLGGPRRAAALARNADVVAVANRHHATAAEATLAWLAGVSPAVVAIPGARSPETARSAARAGTLLIDDAGRDTLSRSFGRSHVTGVTRARHRGDGDVVLVMGIPGAGKTSVAADYVARGYVRLNRDERGGSLRELGQELDRILSSGARRVVLDNTWLTRASRSHVVEAAGRHGTATRCVWLDTPLAQAQVNVIQRMLDRLGSLPGPDDLRTLARRGVGAITPTSQMRALRELEPPSDDEGLDVVERLVFARNSASSDAASTVLVAAAAVGRPGWQAALACTPRGAPHLVFDWRPGADADSVDACVVRVAAEASGSVEGAVCAHRAGPPECWCRPPIPGLALAFAHSRQADVSRSILIGTSRAHRAMAAVLGARFTAL
jgi:aryl-alcohol dehydrogenase-like predicted oxidoreductase